MAKSKVIRATPNLLNCLKVLKEVVKKMPAGNLKKRANFAINYMDKTFKGKPQSRALISCPRNAPIVG